MAKRIVLFDVDGTLTVPRKEAPDSINQLLADLRKVVTVGIVGGSNLPKIKEQLGDDVLEVADYTFSENGLMAHKGQEQLAVQSIKLFLGEDNIKKIINFVLSQEERDAFEQFDHGAHVRKHMIDALKAEFADLGLTYSIGGQISFDVFPHGWDKTYCLQFIEEEFSEIHFFGDKTYQGGNDFEIYESERTIGHHTSGPDDTIKQCTELFLS